HVGLDVIPIEKLDLTVVCLRNAPFDLGVPGRLHPRFWRAVKAGNQLGRNSSPVLAGQLQGGGKQGLCGDAHAPNLSHLWTISTARPLPPRFGPHSVPLPRSLLIGTIRTGLDSTLGNYGISNLPKTNHELTAHYSITRD